MSSIRIWVRQRPILRRSLAWTGVGFLAILVLANVLGSLLAPAGSTVAIELTNDAGVRESLGELEFTLLAMALVHFGGLGQHFGLRWPGRRNDKAAPISGLILVTLTVVTLQLVCAYAGSWVRQQNETGHRDTSWWTATPPVDLAGLSINAGVTEEVFNVGAPIGIATLALVLIARWASKQGVFGARVLRTRTVVVVAVGVAMAFLRVPAHAYQGPIDAWAKLPWALGMLTIFLMVRSLWPLMIGHALYDFFLAGGVIDLDRALPIDPWFSGPVVLLLMIGAATLAWLGERRLRARWRSRTQPQATETPEGGGGRIREQEGASRT